MFKTHIRDVICPESMNNIGSDLLAKTTELKSLGWLIAVRNYAIDRHTPDTVTFPRGQTAPGCSRRNGHVQDQKRASTWFGKFHRLGQYNIPVHERVKA